MKPDTDTEWAETKHWQNGEWFSEMDGGFEITYSEQVNALASKSDIATQSFVFNCEGVAAWYDQTLQSTENAVEFLGSNEHLFETAELRGLSVLQDGCKDKTTGQTVFQLKTKASRMPVIDVLPKSYGEPHQKFGFKAGTVCFL